MLCWCSSDGCKCWLWSDRLFPFALKHSSTKQREHLQHACFWNHCIFYVPLMATLYYIFFRIVLTVFPGIFEAHYFFYFFVSRQQFISLQKISSVFSLSFFLSRSFGNYFVLKILSLVVWHILFERQRQNINLLLFNPKQSSFTLSFAWDSCLPFCLVDSIFQQHDLRQQSYEFVNAVAFSSSFCACCWCGVNTPRLTLYLVCLGARWVFCIDTHPHDQIMCFLHVEEILRYL